MLRQGVNSDGVVMRDSYVEHDPVDIDCSKDGMCRQEFAKECDINVLLATYERTGVLSHFNLGTPQYLDLSDGVPDLQTAFNVFQKAEEAFMTLPASVRKEFANDPLRFIEFAEKPENLEQMRKWGLAKPVPVDPPPAKVEVVNPAPKEPPKAAGA